MRDGGSNQPAFGAADRVVDAATTPPADDGLPTELKGKTPAEIHAFYQRREQAYQSELAERDRMLQSRPNVQPQVVQDTPVTTQEFWNDPVKTTERMLNDKVVTKQEFSRITASAQDGLIYAAKSQCRDQHKDFSRFEADIDTLMLKLTPEQRMQTGMWETVYYQVKGLKADQLIDEARTRPASAEPVAGAPTPQAKPKELTPEQEYVATRLGVSKDKYLQAQERMSAGQWPITMSNTSPK